MDLDKIGETPVGGTRGGIGTFFGGMALALASAYFFVDSVRVTSDGYGVISRGFGGFGGTGSVGVIFLPLFVAVVGLFANARARWPWVLLVIGFALIAIEILSKMNFWFNLKLSHLLIMIVSFAAGVGLILRSLREMPPLPQDD